MDNRLIHGQILVAWYSSLNVDHLIVANDVVANDPLQVTLLKAVAPMGAKVSVMTIEDCVAYCQSPESAKENIFIITKYPEDGLALIEHGLELDTLNLGNQAYVRNSKKLSNSVFLTESGVKALKALHDKGIRLTCRMMPTDSDHEFWPTIEKTFGEWAK
jgi:PTS system mannose-specific IIB component